MRPSSSVIATPTRAAPKSRAQTALRVLFSCVPGPSPTVDVLAPRKPPANAERLFAHHRGAQLAQVFGRSLAGLWADLWAGLGQVDGSRGGAAIFRPRPDVHPSTQCRPRTSS